MEILNAISHTDSTLSPRPRPSPLALLNEVVPERDEDSVGYNLGRDSRRPYCSRRIERMTSRPPSQREPGSTGEVTSPVLRVAIVRGNDLEARELLMFDELWQLGEIAPAAFGDIPTTRYGIDGVRLPISILPSLGARLRRLPLGRTLSEVIERNTNLRLAKSIGLERSLMGFDIVNVRETFHAQSAQAALAVRQMPASRLVVSCFENIPFRYEESELAARHKSLVRASADLFVANSPGARLALLSEGVDDSRIEVIPPAIDTERFAPGDSDVALRSQWGAAASDVVILYAGRLLSEKGLVPFLLAVSDLLRSDAANGSVRLVFHGDGPERPRLARAIASMGLQNLVTFSNWVPTVDMPNVYRSADIVVLPSLSTPYWTEQFGFNLVEAMGCGIPVIGTATGEIPWVIGDAGVVVPEHDPAGLRSAVAFLAENSSERRRLGGLARRTTVDRFSVHAAGRLLVLAFRTAGSRPTRSHLTRGASETSHGE